jgi:hypothetical protein
VRIAIAATGKSKDVAQYLPNNFKVLGRTLDNTGTIIIGVDDHGWSLDKYVIPRLGSALIHCEEVFEINGLNLTQLELNLKLQHEAEPKKKRGRAPALSITETEEVRNAWRENDLLWQRYRAYAHKFDKPHHLTVSDLAIRFRVSEGVINDVINHEGAYKA